MKLPLYLPLTVVLFTACHNRSASADAGNTAGISDSLAEKVKGAYSGKFSKGLISVVINYISGKTVSGYDVHKGLRRNVNGEVALKNGLLSFVLKEPGDNPYDGSFHFSIDTAGRKLSGRWVPFDSTKVPVRPLALTRKNTDPDMMEDNMWFAGDNLSDSVLTFKEDGTCTFQYYERPADSTSQLVTVRGNYERNSKTYRIEWQKSDHWTDQSMRLVVEAEKEGNDSVNYTPRRLRGNGLTFTLLMD